MDHETALYQMNSEENLFWGGGGRFTFIFRKGFLWKVGTLSQEIVEVHLLSVVIVFELPQ